MRIKYSCSQLFTTSWRRILCLTKHYPWRRKGGGGVAPCILNLGPRWRWVVSFTAGKGPPPPGTHRIGGWVGPRAGLNVVTRRKEFLPLPGIEPRTVQLITVRTRHILSCEELYWESVRFSTFWPFFPWWVLFSKTAVFFKRVHRNLRCDLKALKLQLHLSLRRMSHRWIERMQSVPKLLKKKVASIYRYEYRTDSMERVKSLCVSYMGHAVRNCNNAMCER
jgi:hypothetical protein